MAKVYEMYWVSVESARQRREFFTNPKPKIWYRFNYPSKGNLETVPHSWTPTPLYQAPGYYTVMCLESGSIFDYTERTKFYESQPNFHDAAYVGSYCFDCTVLLRHKDGMPGKYRIGFGGTREQQLTPEQARHVIAICEVKNEPMPHIVGFESNQVYADYYNHACKNQERIRELLMAQPAELFGTRPVHQHGHVRL